MMFNRFFRSFISFNFKINKRFLSLLVALMGCITLTTPEASQAEVISMALEATSVAKSFFASEGDVEIENIIFNIDEDMNQKGAVTVYFVVCYDQVLFNALKTDSADQFKRRIDTYMHDYPDKIVILKWDLVAKRRVTSRIPVAKYYERGSLSPVGGFIFVTYSSPGEHRYRIPGSWSGMEISLKRTECKLRQLN